MTLLEAWREKAYQQEMSKEQEQAFWNDYFAREKSIYEQLLVIRKRLYPVRFPSWQRNTARAWNLWSAFRMASMIA